MIKLRSASTATAALLAPLAVSAVAIAALVAFPGSRLVWQLGAWSLAIAALLLIVLLPVTAYALARNAAARTWPRTIGFVLGTLYMAVLAFGALYSGA